MPPSKQKCGHFHCFYHPHNRNGEGYCCECEIERLEAEVKALREERRIELRKLIALRKALDHL